MYTLASFRNFSGKYSPMKGTNDERMIDLHDSFVWQTQADENMRRWLYNFSKTVYCDLMMASIY